MHPGNLHHDRFREFYRKVIDEDAGLRQVTGTPVEVRSWHIPPIPEPFGMAASSVSRGLSSHA
jgi:hypothetical protein